MSKLFIVLGAIGLQEGSVLVNHVLQHPELYITSRLPGVVRNISKPTAVALKGKVWTL